VTSHRPSGIGFVNFGQIDRLDGHAPIQTFGTGARLQRLRRVTAAPLVRQHRHPGDGSVGVQVSKALPVLEISGDLTTHGGEGQPSSRAFRNRSRPSR
jgi:hypothetical protein